MFAPSVVAHGLATSKWTVWLRCVWIGTWSDAPIRSLRSGAYGDTPVEVLRTEVLLRTVETRLRLHHGAHA